MTPEKHDEIALYDVAKIFRLSFRRQKVGVEGLSFSVPRGQIVGLLGPNGSGKSTTLKMVLGFLAPTRGEILICGEPSYSRAARRQIGYLPENPRFQKFLTAKEILRYFGRLLEMSGAALESRVDELLCLVGLEHAATERVGGFSKGMGQRLAVAQAILHRPRLLIFDEPMSGLDPLGRMEIRKLIASIHNEMKDTTIFFSSHILGDVEALCSHVVVLQKGKLKRACPIEDLLFGKSSRRFEVLAQAPSSTLSSALWNETYWHTHSTRPFRGGLQVLFDGPADLAEGLQRLQAMGAQVWSVTTQTTNLERALFEEKIA